MPRLDFLIRLLSWHILHSFLILLSLFILGLSIVIRLDVFLELSVNKVNSLECCTLLGSSSIQMSINNWPSDGSGLLAALLKSESDH